MNHVLIDLNTIRCHLTREQQFYPLNWQLIEGQNWVFYGPNGSGKTALAKVIAKRLPIASGERHYTTQFDPKRDIEWVSVERQQALLAHDKRFDDSETRDDALDVGTTVKDIVFKGCAPNAEQQQWLDDFAMTDHLEKGIRYISTGQLRKTLLLKALVQPSRLLILDDPLAGLDAASQTHAEALIKLLVQRHNHVILLLSRKHPLMKHFSHIALLENCAIHAQGETKALLPQLEQNQPTNIEPNQRLTLHTAATTQYDVHTPLIEFNHVVAKYRDKRVFKAESFRVEQGQHTAISGPNGSGKSTLMQMLTGENTLAYGQDVRILGERRGSGESVWEIRQHFGIVSNNIHNNFGRGWKVVDVVISGLYDSIGLYQQPSDKDRINSLQCLRFFSIAHLAEKAFHRLSYGQQRLILLARAIIKQPPLLLLDEACTGLDEQHFQQFLAALSQLVKASPITVLNVSHLASEQPHFIQQHWGFEKGEEGIYLLHQCHERS